MNNKDRIGVRIGFLLAIVCLMAGCGPRPISTTATIHFDTSTREELAQSANILESRFKEILPSSSSGVTASVGEQVIVFEFRGEAPSDQMIRDHATQGIFRIYAANSPLMWLVTDRDVERVSASAGVAGVSLELSVSESAGRRLQNYTSRNLGRVLVTSWNGKEQTRARVQGVFSRQFQTTGMDRDTAGMLMTSLKFGRLPVAVREVLIAHPGTG